MTAEQKCEVLKSLLAWAKNGTDECRYMEERIYAVKVAKDMVTIVKANNPADAIAKAKSRINMTMNGNGGTQIGYVQTLTL